MPLTIRLLLRQWKSGALTLLLLSTVVAVTCICTIALVNSRIHNAIMDDASHLLAADVQIRGSVAIPDQWQQGAIANQLSVAHATHFSAMAFAGDTAQLSSIKAVSEGYPLKGEVTLSDQPFGPSYTVKARPASGEVWMSSRLFDLLGIQVGDQVDIGNKTFIAAKALIKEPDNPQTYFNTAPRIMMNSADIDATGAIRVGSRVRYGLMLAGDKTNLQAFEDSIEAELGKHHRWVSVEKSNRFVGSALTKAKSYIFLAGNLCVLLAGVAIALSARRFANDQLPQVALLKTFGLQPGKLQRHYILTLVICGLGAALVGTLLGWLIHLGLLSTLSNYISSPPPPSMDAYLVGGITGFLALVGFAAPTIISLKNVSPIQVIQQRFTGTVIGNLPVLMFGVATMCLLTYGFSRSLVVSFALLLGVSVCFGLTLVLARGLTIALSKVAPHVSPQIRMGLVNMERHKLSNLTQISVFALIFLFLYTLILTSYSLINTWQQNIPKDAPNHFIFNIFSHEREAIETYLEGLNTERQPFYPMIRGRIVSVEGVSLKELSEAKEHHVNYERELNLTWSDELGSDNTLVEGQWWETVDPDTLLISVEEDFAEGLDLQLGDTMVFSIAGTEVGAQVASVRKVTWDSMNPNFYVIFNQPIVANMSSNWITSFYIAPENKRELSELVRRFPTISLIDFDQTMAQIQNIIQKVTLAVQLIWSMIMVAGVLVLITSIQSTLAERLHEGAILRTLGASKALIQKMLATEFVCIGLLAGLLATIGAELVFFFVQKNVFLFEPALHWPLWIAGPLISVIVISVAGLFSTKKIMNVSPLRLLRQSA